MENDEIDRKILEILSRNGRTKFTDIAKTIKRTEGTVRNRIRRLQEKGIIQGFRVVTDPENLGFAKQAIVTFHVEPRYETYAQLSKLPNICNNLNCELLSLYRSNGNSSFMVEVLSRNAKGLDFFINELMNFDGVENIDILLKEEKIYDQYS